MQRTIITHVGASLLAPSCLAFKDYGGASELRAALRAEHEDALAHLDPAADHLEAELGAIWATGADTRWRDSPAEIASLSRLALAPADRVVLLHSDTLTGRFCAALLQRALSASFTPLNGYPHSAPGRVVARNLTGLRVTDRPGAAPAAGGTAAERFVRDGLRDYVEHVWSAYDELAASLSASGDEGRLIFNVTAGYKSMVPIARDLALLLPEHIRGLERPITTELCVLYEESSELIRYASLPVQFDWSKVYMAHLGRADADAPGARLRYDHTAADNLAFFERAPDDPSYAHLSPLGRVVWELGKKLAYADP